MCRRFVIVYGTFKDQIGMYKQSFSNAQWFEGLIAGTSNEPPQYRHCIPSLSTNDLDAPWSLTNITGLWDMALRYKLIYDIFEAYVFISDNYAEGDEIFIFGFSRGAFTALVLANFIARLGLMRRGDGIHTNTSMWAGIRAYIDGHLDDFAATCQHLSRREDERDERYSGPAVYKSGVDVLGCWDTLANLGGWPWRSKRKSGRVSGRFKHLDTGPVKGIKRAFHALALDEHGRRYTSLLWQLPKDVDPETMVLKQCWFPGSHRTVIGGYQDCPLSNLSMFWMIEQCKGLLDFKTQILEKVPGYSSYPSPEYCRDPDSCPACRAHLDTSGKKSRHRTLRTHSPGEETGELLHESAIAQLAYDAPGPPVYDPGILKEKGSLNDFCT